MFGDYYACDYASRVQKAFMYTDAGVVGTTNEDKLREYLRDKMLELKKRKLWKKLGEMESDFD